MWRFLRNRVCGYICGGFSEIGYLVIFVVFTVVFADKVDKMVVKRNADFCICGIFVYKYGKKAKKICKVNNFIFFVKKILCILSDEFVRLNTSQG